MFCHVLTFQSFREEVHMVAFVLSGFHDIAIKSSVESCVREILLGKLGQALMIESIFEMFQGQGIVKNIGWAQSRLARSSPLLVICQFAYHHWALYASQRLGRRVQVSKGRGKR